MQSSIVRLAAEQGEHAANHLPMHPIMFGVIAMAIFVFLLLVTVAFRSVHTRHR
ncbi:hypothetical protein [Georgenia wangjunii]|uniref:hypothetical protein n=1 Tax=Georgenia wangjunii TaxID=3117730 RepID=UPI002F26D1CA